MIRILHYEYYTEILHWNIFFTVGRADVLFESKIQMTLVKYCKQKINSFWNIKYILDENPLLEAAQKIATMRQS